VNTDDLSTVERVYSALIPMLLHRGVAMTPTDVLSVAQAAVEASGVMDYETAEKWDVSCLDCASTRELVVRETERAARLELERGQALASLRKIRTALRRLAE